MHKRDNKKYPFGTAKGGDAVQVSHSVPLTAPLAFQAYGLNSAQLVKRTGSHTHVHLCSRHSRLSCVSLPSRQFTGVHSNLAHVYMKSV
eukprot:1158924-Pelagomonas_calceolata.AAC.20